MSEAKKSDSTDQLGMVPERPPCPICGLTRVHFHTEDQVSAGVARALAAERERIAAHFDSRDKGSGGFYEPHEPAAIIRALGPNEKGNRPA